MIDSTKQDKPRADVGAQKVAAVYAKAFLATAEKSGQLDQMVDEVHSVADVLREYPRAEELFASALVPHEEKVQMLDRVFGSKVSPQVLDFLKVLSRNGRLGIVPTVSLELQSLYNQLRGRIRVDVLTASPMEAGVSRNLENSLRQILGGEPQVASSVEPGLIGGVVLRVGDTVYDGSVARQLEQVREQMIMRTVHEIQSRRDRFRHSGGD
ncbi:MAG: ATP synthase F1 subunit delta [Planctomycetota bacterium]|nr:MAG: ATP synthase F1 subunit delta [Planctomycetota bacterium]